MYLLSRFTEDDWVGIIQYLQSKKRWTFVIHNFDGEEGPWKINIRGGTPEELAHNFVTADLDTTIGEAIDLGKCPFLRKVANTPCYECSIQEAKPVLCEAFNCEGHQYAPDDHPLKEESERFGREFEARCVRIAKRRGYKRYD